MGPLDLAGALALAAEGLVQLALGVEDEDLAKLLVGQIDPALLVGQGLDRQADHHLVVLAAAAPEFLQFQFDRR